MIWSPWARATGMGMEFNPSRVGIARPQNTVYTVYSWNKCGGGNAPSFSVLIGISFSRRSDIPTSMPVFISEVVGIGCIFHDLHTHVRKSCTNFSCIWTRLHASYTHKHTFIYIYILRIIIRVYIYIITHTHIYIYILWRSALANGLDARLWSFRSMYMYMNMYMYMYINIQWIHIHTYNIIIYIQMYLFCWVCLRAHTHIYIYLYICIYVHAYIYIYATHKTM